MKKLFPMMLATVLLGACQPTTQQEQTANIETTVVTDSMKTMYNHYAKWYAQGVGCCAMLKMWHATEDAKYYDYVAEWADTVVYDDGNIHLYDMSTYNIDYINSGKTLFDVYKQTGNEKYKKAMDLLVEQMKHHPRTLEGGYWHKLRYQHQIWLDGLYMGSPFLARYGAEFNQPEWIDEAVKQFTICHKRTHDAKTGLYHHAWDESKSQRWANKKTGHSPNFWGRSIGWWFMAMVDVLDYIPSAISKDWQKHYQSIKMKMACGIRL